MSSLTERVKLQSMNSEAELIIDLISLEQLRGEKMKLRELSFYIEPHRMVRLMKLLPWQRLSVSFVIDVGLNHIFRFVTFHIFERVSDNVDSVIVISDELAASVTVVSHIL